MVLTARIGSPSTGGRAGGDTWVSASRVVAAGFSVTASSAERGGAEGKCVLQPAAVRLVEPLPRVLLAGAEPPVPVMERPGRRAIAAVRTDPSSCRIGSLQCGQAAIHLRLRLWSHGAGC